MPRGKRRVASETGTRSTETGTRSTEPGLGPREAEGVRGDADLARTAAGWRYRFTAEGARGDEMAALYRELGFDVAADPVATSVDPVATSVDVEEVCTACYDQSPRPYKAIYTRRPGDLPTA